MRQGAASSLAVNRNPLSSTKSILSTNPVREVRLARKAKVREEEERLAELRRAEIAKIRAETERRAAAERRRRDASSIEAQKWEDARRARAYGQWVQGAASEASKRSIARTEEIEEAVAPTTAWIEWAQNVAEEIDPTAVRRERGGGRESDGP
jgi:hypothetical protein